MSVVGMGLRRRLLWSEVSPARCKRRKWRPWSEAWKGAERLRRPRLERYDGEDPRRLAEIPLLTPLLAPPSVWVKHHDVRMSSSIQTFPGVLSRRLPRGHGRVLR